MSLIKSFEKLIEFSPSILETPLSWVTHITSFLSKKTSVTEKPGNPSSLETLTNSLPTLLYKPLEVPKKRVCFRSAILETVTEKLLPSKR